MSRGQNGDNPAANSRRNDRSGCCVRGLFSNRIHRRKILRAPPGPTRRGEGNFRIRKIVDQRFCISVPTAEFQRASRGRHLPLPGPGNATMRDIDGIGLGRYSQENGKGFVISASDNSNPRGNGNDYWIVIPPQRR